MCLYEGQHLRTFGALACVHVGSIYAFGAIFTGGACTLVDVKLALATRESWRRKQTEMRGGVTGKGRSHRNDQLHSFTLIYTSRSAFITLSLSLSLSNCQSKRGGHDQGYQTKRNCLFNGMPSDAGCLLCLIEVFHHNANSPIQPVPPTLESGPPKKAPRNPWPPAIQLPRRPNIHVFYFSYFNPSLNTSAVQIYSLNTLRATNPSEQSFSTQ